MHLPRIQLSLWARLPGPFARWSFTCLALSLAASAFAATASVTPYDWSHASPASKRYHVTVNGEPVFVGDFWNEHFTHFAFTGSVEVEVTFLPGTIDPTLTALSPKSWNVPYTIEGNRLRFTIDRPKSYVLRINEPADPGVGLHYLMLFAEGPETGVPDPADPHTIDVTAAGVDNTGATDVTANLSRLIETAPAGSTLLLPRGTYHIEDLKITRAGTSLYLAPGAFLQARQHGTKRHQRRGISIDRAPGVALRGRGLLQADGYALRVDRSPDLMVEDLMIRSVAMGKQNVTPSGNEDGGRGVILYFSDRYHLSNVKILTIMDQADGKGKDALNLGSSSDGLVERCFTLSGDDTYTIKGKHDDHEWITVDLGSVQPLGKIITRWGEAWLPSYQLEASENGDDWQIIKTVENDGQPVQTITVRGRARFLRLQSLKTAIHYYAGDLLRELEVYPTDSSSENLALRRPVRSSPFGNPAAGGHEAARAVDGDPTTSWAQEYRSHHVLFRDNVALVTANPIKIGTGSDYAADDITWENHDVIDAGSLNADGHNGGGMMNFSHYDYPGREPREQAMTGILVRNARFEDTVGFMQVGWYFWRTDKTYWFETRLDATFENVTVDRVHRGMTRLQIFADPERASIHLKFINLKVAGRMIASLEDLAATGVIIDIHNFTADDHIEFLLRPESASAETCDSPPSP